jgi:FkbM family methyltransferase
MFHLFNGTHPQSSMSAIAVTRSPMHNAIVRQEPPTHHEVFSEFRRWSGEVSAGFEIDFLGTRNRTDFYSLMHAQPHDRYEVPSYPHFDEEYFEWIDLLEAVALAGNRFIMLELGAGFGRWTARAAAASSQRRLSYLLVAVEAEPTHFEWLRRNLRDNSVEMGNCRLVNAAVTDRDGKVTFQVGNPADSYGQSIGGNTEIDAISLRTLLLPLDFVDLIDMDIQGAELDVLAAATEPLNQKVRRVHIETHSDQLHLDILRFFRHLGWKPHFLYEGNTADITPWGKINFLGGTQSWLNPRLHSAAELRSVPTSQNSLRCRSLAAARRLINRVAPIGTMRRRIFTQTFSGLAAPYRRDAEDVARRG